MTERRVGMYTCSKCGTKFPTVISRQRYLIVAEEQLKSIQDELSSVKKGNEDLSAKVEGMVEQQREMESSMERVAKENEVKRLQVKLAELEEFVGYLRKEKGELEQKASRLRKALDSFGANGRKGVSCFGFVGCSLLIQHGLLRPERLNLALERGCGLLQFEGGYLLVQ